MSLAEKRHIDRGFYGDAAIDELDAGGKWKTGDRRSSSSSSSSSLSSIMQRGAGGIRLWRRGKSQDAGKDAESYVIPATNGAENIAKGETTALGAKTRWKENREDYGWTWNG